ncbi:hypothetical protein Dimus_007732 [Dionaea muscipula]
MEQPSQVSAPGSRYLNLKKSFKLAARSLLTACSSKEDFFKAFPRFTTIEQERLYGLFIQVITSLHANVEVTWIICMRHIFSSIHIFLFNLLVVELNRFGFKNKMHSPSSLGIVATSILSIYMT